MRHLATAADRIDYWIRRRIVPDPCPSRVNSGRDRRVALAAIGRSLKDQYDAAAAPVPARLLHSWSNSKSRRRADALPLDERNRENRQFISKAARPGSRAAFCLAGI